MGACRSFRELSCGVWVFLLLLCLCGRTSGAEDLPRGLVRVEDDQDVSGCERDYPECTGNQTCFVFLDEDPFVILPTNHKGGNHSFRREEGFPCREFREHNVGGVTFELLGPWFSRVARDTDLDYRCYYAGDDCGWNSLVNLVSHGGPPGAGKNYSLVLFGSLLEIPRRVRLNSTASVSYADDRLVVVGRTEDIPESFFSTLVGPFHYYVWLMVLVTVIIGFVAGTLLKYSDPRRMPVVSPPTGGDRMRSDPNNKTRWISGVSAHCLDTMVQGLGYMFDKEEYAGPTTTLASNPSHSSPSESTPAFEGPPPDRRADSDLGWSLSAGAPEPLVRWGEYDFPKEFDVEQGIGSEELSSRSFGDSLAGSSSSLAPSSSWSLGPKAPAAQTTRPPRRKRWRSSYKLGCYFLMRVMFTITMTFFLGIFLIFYEAALTNFLFQNTVPKLQQSVTRLTDAELRQYSVLNNSAVNDVFVTLQTQNTNWKDRSVRPWDDCPDIDSCFERVRAGIRRFLVVQETVARFKIDNDSACEELTIYQTEETLFDFNAGLIYGFFVDEKVREQIDLELLTGRITTRAHRVYDKFLEHADCSRSVSFISWNVYLVPSLIVICSLTAIILVQVLMLLCNYRQRRRARRRQRRIVAAVPVEEEFQVVHY